MSAITAAFVAGCLLGLMLRRGVAPGGANGGVWYPPATTEPPSPPPPPPPASGLSSREACEIEAAIRAAEAAPLRTAAEVLEWIRQQGNPVHIPNPKDQRSLAEIEAGVSHA